MATWKDNALMWWYDSYDVGYKKVTDHNRSPLTMSVERIEIKQRMVDATLRRYVVDKKRTWSCSWEMIPSKSNVANAITTVDGGLSGEQIESFHDRTDREFRMILRRGSAIGLTAPTPSDSSLPYEDDNFYIARVMIIDFSKDREKRGRIDYWNLSITLEEV